MEKNMVTPKEIMELEFQTANKLELNHSEFIDWIGQNTLEGEDFIASRDFLAYLGFAFFESMRMKTPGLTLDDVYSHVFSGTKSTEQ